MFIGEWINIQVFDSIPLINLSIFMPIPSFFHYCSSIIELDVRDVMASEASLLYMIVLAILGFLFFQMKLPIVLLRSVKNCVHILKGIALNL